MNTSYKNYKKSCLRKFRLCWRRKVVIPNTDFKASYNCENSVFSIYTVFPCIHLHVKEQDSKNHYLIISYSKRQYKLSLHLPLNYWYIFKKLAHHISHAHLSSVGALFPPVLDSSFAFLHMTLMTAVRVSQYALAHDRTANWFVLHRTIKAKIKMWENL